MRESGCQGWLKKRSALRQGEHPGIFLFSSFLYDGEALHAASHTADYRREREKQGNFPNLNHVLHKCIGSFKMHGQLFS